jgi:protease I
MKDLHNKRVAVVATNGFEESELTEPVKALRDAGTEAVIVSTQAEPIQAFKHYQPSITLDVDTTFDERGLTNTMPCCFLEAP